MPSTTLESIIEFKKRELEERRFLLPLKTLKARIPKKAKARDMAGALRGKDFRLIMEVKKASPSRGVLVKDFRPLELAQTYERNGAAAISVVTDVFFFQGGLRYLAEIKDKVKIPVLRKDFIFDEYQVYESAAVGADALLLIAGIMDEARLKELYDLTKSLGMQALIEADDETQVETALKAGAEIIGINNRDLKTFQTSDLATTERLYRLIPIDRIIVCESGVKNREQIQRLKAMGINAALVGEALVTAPDIPAKIRELLS